jgi:hypothetical protein
VSQRDGLVRAPGRFPFPPEPGSNVVSSLSGPHQLLSSRLPVFSGQMREPVGMAAGEGKGAATGTTPPSRDYSIALEEARRTLDHQRDDLKSIRDRAVAVLGIASVSASVAGGLSTTTTSKPGISGWAYAAGGFLALVIVVTLLIAWPRKVVFNQNGTKIIKYIDLDKPNPQSNVQRNLAIYMQRQYDRNAVLLEWMLWGLRLDIVLLAVQLGLLGVDLWR